MDIFEFFRTTFNLVASFFTLDILIYIGFAALLLMITWSVLSLVFSFERRFVVSCNSVISYVRKNSLSPENYPTFTNLWKNFPLSMKRAWKRYEIKRKGIASDYLFQQECVDEPLSGGISKQNRSIMKSATWLVVGIQALFAVVIVGSIQSKMAADSLLSTKVVTEAALIPLIFLVLFRINYYIYVATRQNLYKEAVQSFQDMVDLLDEKIDLDSIFFGGEQTISIVSTIYQNDTLLLQRETERVGLDKTRNKIWANSSDAEGRGLVIATSGIVGKEELTHKSKNTNVIAEKVVKAIIDQDEKKPTKDAIDSEEKFVSQMAVVENLLEEVKNEKDSEKRKKLNKKINGIVAELTAYKNAAKKKGK